MVLMIALSWSGGKDSMLALDRLVRAGRDVRFLLNLYDGPSGRVRFHGVRRELIQRQAERLGMRLVDLATDGHDFEEKFLNGLARLRVLGAKGIAFGNIHLEDVRAWYEERTTANGFAHIEPLWGEHPASVVAEVIARGYSALLTSVDVKRGRREWLGRVLDADLLRAIGSAPGVDAAGEAGEYHTLAFAGPLFASPIGLERGEVRESEGHVLLDLCES